jgi:hypothetical protein
MEKIAFKNNSVGGGNYSISANETLFCGANQSVVNRIINDTPKYFNLFGQELDGQSGNFLDFDMTLISLALYCPFVTNGGVLDYTNLKITILGSETGILDTSESQVNQNSVSTFFDTEPTLSSTQQWYLQIECVNAGAEIIFSSFRGNWYANI